MNKLLVITLLTLVSVYGYSQTQTIDSLKEIIEKHEGRITALDERVLVNEADLGKLNKIKVSGYIQSQWELYDKNRVVTNEPTNTFYVRRGRVKFTYEALDGVKFVIQPDFISSGVSLKDAYAVVNIPKFKDFTLWAGQFNRINYEVEYSSSQREVLERSRVIRAIYPGEREIGVKLEYIGSKLPLKFQLMTMNGNFTGTQAKDVDSEKDIMARLVYSIKLPDAGVGIDLGGNTYLGSNKAKINPYVSNSDGTLDSVNVGHNLDKKWFGGEIQIFADVLGGLAIKGEYIAGTNSVASTTTSPAYNASIGTKLGSANKLNNFAGYYLYFIKNIGPKNQLIARYDYYDPNTKLSGDMAASSVNCKTLTVSWQHYLNDFIRITVNYEMPKFEVNASRPSDYKDVTYGNTLGVRIQAKF
jgi:phosphate-selective porin